MLNKVLLVGRLTSDPELRQAGATPVASLRVATNTFAGKDPDSGERREHTEFMTLVLFGRQAQVAAEHLKKGRLVYADGRLQTRSWEGQDGLQHSSTEVVVDSLQFLSPRSERQAV